MYISAFLTPRKTAIKTLGRFPDLPRRKRPSRLLQTVGFTPDSLFMTKPDGFYVITKPGAKV